MSLDILYLAYNRLEYTRTSFELMKKNTDWSLVDRLVVYDDGSTDGTDDYLREAGERVHVSAFEFRMLKFRAPAATMNDYLSTSEAEMFVKIDNDIALPPDWLPSMYRVMRQNEDIELLGMEAARTGTVRDAQSATGPGHYGWIDGSHIGGVGIMRTESFHRRPAIMARGRFGFTEWQHRHDPVRGWIVPDLRVVQLDLIPEEPWASLAHEYIARKWQRIWPKYDPLQPWWWEWLPEST
jgi:glycosyltransferase involved in cell wall biosynthesis